MHFNEMRKIEEVNWRRGEEFLALFWILFLKYRVLHHRPLVGCQEVG